jgi:Cysteine-rich secretory protein family
METAMLRCGRVVGLMLALALGASGARAAYADAPAPAQKALDLVNTQYREPLGLPDLDWNPLLAEAASAHARYFALGGEFGHEETPGQPGFTGVEPWDRCEAVGAPPCGEVAHGYADIVTATASWLDTPYHGEPLISAAEVGFGWADHGGSVGDLSGAAAEPPVDPDAPLNTPAAAVRLWPADGQTNVPVEWSGGEIPDPLQNYASDDPVGPVFFLEVRTGSVTLTLTDSARRQVPLLEPDGAATVSEATFSAPASAMGDAWHEVFAGTLLRAQSRYTLTLRYADGTTQAVHFTTGKDTEALSACSKPIPGVVRDGKLTVLYGWNYSCVTLQAVLETSRGGAWHVTDDMREIRLRPGQRLRWRWLVRDTVIAQGVVVGRR